MHRLALASRLGRVAVRGSAAALLASALLVALTSAAHAAVPSELVCTGGGSVAIDRNADGTFGWVLSGIGSCTVSNHGAQARQVELDGTATTDSLGLCSGAPLVTAFAMKVTATFVSLSPTRDLVSTVQQQVWSVPATTFPVDSPFGITDTAGSVLGAGELATHIFAQCPPGGTPAMQVAWVQTA